MRTVLLRQSRRHRRIITLTVLALAFYLWHGLWAQFNYRSTGYDLGIFDQVLRHYAHFDAPLVPLKGTGFNVLGDHFHPIIVTLVPFYWIFDSVNVLIVAQAVLTAATVPVVYRFARRRTDGEWLALLFAFTFAFGWGVQTMIDYDFHEIAFATPLLALAIDALDRKADRQLVLWCALLVLVREDMGILVALLAVLLFARRQGSNGAGIRMIWRLPALLFALGVVAYVFATKVVIPHFSPAGYAYAGQFGELGSSIGDALKNAVIKPWHAVDVFFTPGTKSKTLLLLFAPFALLPLRSRYCWLVLPLLAERMFNERDNLWKTVFHYNALPWLILTLAAVDGAYRLGLFRPDPWLRIPQRAMAGVMLGFPILLIILGSNITGIAPATELRAHSNPGKGPGWLAQAKAVVAYLPDDVCVLADNRLVPQLTRRDWVTTANVPAGPPDFIALDLSANGVGGNPPVPTPSEVQQKAIDDGYVLAMSTGPFVVYRSPDYTGPSKACDPLGAGK